MLVVWWTVTPFPNPSWLIWVERRTTDVATAQRITVRFVRTGKRFLGDRESCKMVSIVYLRKEQQKVTFKLCGLAWIRLEQSKPEISQYLGVWIDQWQDDLSLILLSWA